jgi:pyruvate/2-oxoglutarate dehydrogenase complex dihydrolipoamide dehydrogenase (E3) component
MDYSKVPWSTYSDPELASIGYNEQRAQQAGIEYRTVLTSFEEVDRARAEGYEEGRIKILLDRKERIIGSQIAAGHAGELLPSAIFAIQNRWKLGSLLGPIFPYPTMAEIYKRAAGNYLSPRLFNPRVRGILKKLFGYRGSGPVSAK